MTRVLIVHRDPGLRARIAEALTEGSDLDLELDQAEELAAADGLAAPDVVYAQLPSGNDGRPAFPAVLASTPRIVILDEPTAEQLRDALQLHPVAVTVPDSHASLFSLALHAALRCRGLVLANALQPAFVEMMQQIIDEQPADEATDADADAAVAGAAPAPDRRPGEEGA